MRPRPAPPRAPASSGALALVAGRPRRHAPPEPHPSEVEYSCEFVVGIRGEGTEGDRGTGDGLASTPASATDVVVEDGGDRVSLDPFTGSGNAAGGVHHPAAGDRL